MRSAEDVPIGRDPRAARKLHQQKFISKVSKYDSSVIVTHRLEVALRRALSLPQNSINSS